MSLHLVPGSSGTGQCCYPAQALAGATRLTADFTPTHHT
jgi:hypothetical protein